MVGRKEFSEKLDVHGLKISPKISSGHVRHLITQNLQNMVVWTKPLVMHFVRALVYTRRPSALIVSAIYIFQFPLFYIFQLRRDLLAQRDRDDLNMSQYAMSISDRDTIASMSERASLIDGVIGNETTPGGTGTGAGAHSTTGIGIGGLHGGGLPSSSRIGLARALGQLSAASADSLAPRTSSTLASGASTGASIGTGSNGLNGHLPMHSIGVERSSSLLSDASNSIANGGFGLASSSSAALASLASLSLGGHAPLNPRLDRAHTESSTASQPQSAFASALHSSRSALDAAPSEAGSDRVGFLEHMPLRHQRRAGAYRHANPISIPSLSSSPPVSAQAVAGSTATSNTNISSSYLSSLARQTSGTFARHGALNPGDEHFARTLAAANRATNDIHLHAVPRLNMLHIFLRDLQAQHAQNAASDADGVSDDGRSIYSQCLKEDCPVCARAGGYAHSVVSVSTAGGHRRGRERSGSRIRFDVDDIVDKNSVIDDSASNNGRSGIGIGIGSAVSAGAASATSAPGDEESYPPSIAGSVGGIGGLARDHSVSLDSASASVGRPPTSALPPLPPGGLGFNSGRSGPGSVSAGNGGLADDASSVTGSIADSVAESTSSLTFAPPPPHVHTSHRHMRPPPTSKHKSRGHSRSLSRSSSIRSHGRHAQRRHRYQNSINVMSQSPPTHSFVPSPMHSPRRVSPSRQPAPAPSPRTQSAPKASFSPGAVPPAPVLALPTLLELPASASADSPRSAANRDECSPSRTRRPPSPALSSRSQPPPNSPSLSSATSVMSRNGIVSPKMSAKHMRSRSTSGPTKNQRLDRDDASTALACVKSLRNDASEFLSATEDDVDSSAVSIDGDEHDESHQIEHKKSFLATLSALNLENHQKTQQKLSIERGEDQSHVQRVVNSLRGTLQHLHAASATSSDSSVGIGIGVGGGGGTSTDNRSREAIALTDVNISRILSHFSSPPPALPSAASVFSQVSSAPTTVSLPPFSTSTPNSLLDDGMLSESAFSVKSFDSSSQLNNMAAVK